MKILTIIISILISMCAYADSQILAVQGDLSIISIKRNTRSIPVQEFLVLQEKDEIHIQEGNAIVVLDLDGLQKVNITHENSPYRIYDSVDNTSVINNGLAWLKSFYSTDKGKQPKSVSSRGGDGPLKLIGMDLRNNVIPRSLKEITFFWARGEAPYRVKVYDQSDQSDHSLVFTAEVQEREVSLPLNKLPGSNYVFEVSHQLDNAGSADHQNFTLVKDEDISEDVSSLIRALGNESNQQTVAVLSTLPEWQFYALQLAKINNDTLLVNALMHKFGM